MDKQLPTQETGDICPLSQLSEIKQLGQWIYRFIHPALKGKVLEIGSNKGDLSSCFAQDGFALRISDPNSSNCERLLTRFSREPMIKAIYQIDTQAPTFATVYKELVEGFDSIVSIVGGTQTNSEPLVINNAKTLLRNRGRLIMLLPIHIALYGELNMGFRHWRRTNETDIKKRLGLEWEILHIQYLSISKMLRSSTIIDHDNLSDAHPCSLYYQYVPSFQANDPAPLDHAGLYAIAIARKIAQHAVI